jgi:hypothetical protein
VSRFERQVVSVALSLTLVTGAIGCSGGAQGRPKVVPVTGAVAYNGKAIEGATVSFWVEGSPRAATGTTDEKGEFQLSTFAINDGCVPGAATITVAKEEVKAGGIAGASATPPDAIALAKLAAEMAAQKPEKPIIPLKYSSVTQTPLKETVAADGENRFVLQLKD